jgi:hypothetical protein
MVNVRTLVPWEGIRPSTSRYAEVIQVSGYDTTYATGASKGYASLSPQEISWSYIDLADSEEQREG